MTLSPKQAALVKQAPAAQRPALRRLFASQKQIMGQNAQLRSIPRQVLLKPQRFMQGAPSVSHHFAERGQGYYDAFAHQPEEIVLASQVGPCTPIEGYTLLNVNGGAGVTNLEYESTTGVSTVLTVGLTDNTTLLVFNPGSSDKRICQIYRLAVDPTLSTKATVTREDVDVQAFTALGPTHMDLIHDLQRLDGTDAGIEHATGRVENIPLRGSLRIRNVTENLAVGGEVRMLRYNGGVLLGHDVPASAALSLNMGVKEYLDICKMMRDTKRTHSMDGHELKETHQSNTYPADHVRSMTFETDTSFEETVRSPSYCTLLILVDNFKASGSQVNNTYSVGMTVQRAARFKPGTILHSKAINPPSHQPSHAEMTRGEADRPATSRVHQAIKSVIDHPVTQTLAKVGAAHFQRKFMPIKMSVKDSYGPFAGLH
jgi:hypothetical protein